MKVSDMPFTRSTSTLARLLLCSSAACSSSPPLIDAHVVLEHPTPRTDNDYLYTFQKDVCDPSSTCAAFCGDPYDAAKNPVTILPVGVPTVLRWKTNVVHQPLKYRLSLNPAAGGGGSGGGDGEFDSRENILTTVSHAEAADPDNAGMAGRFSAEVVIPEAALETCGLHNRHDRRDDVVEPCVLQLWDLYYFVSCANVLLTTDVAVVANQGPTAPPANNDPTILIATTALPQSPPPLLPEQFIDTILFEGASFDDYRVTSEMDDPDLDPTLYLERCRDYTFVINAPGHPFVIKTQPGLGLDDVLDPDDPLSNYYYSVSDSYPKTEGMERGSFMFRAGEDAPEGGLFYQCTLHENMVGEIVFVDGDGACNDAAAAAAVDGGSDKAEANTTGTSTVGWSDGSLEGANDTVAGGESDDAEIRNSTAADDGNAIMSTSFYAVLDRKLFSALVAGTMAVLQ